MQLKKGLNALIAVSALITAEQPATFDVFTTPTASQQPALDLIKQIRL